MLDTTNVTKGYQRNRICSEGIEVESEVSLREAWDYFIKLKKEKSTSLVE